MRKVKKKLKVRLGAGFERGGYEQKLLSGINVEAKGQFKGLKYLSEVV